MMAVSSPGEIKQTTRGLGSGKAPTASQLGVPEPRVTRPEASGTQIWRNVLDAIAGPMRKMGSATRKRKLMVSVLNQASVALAQGFSMKEFLEHLLELLQEAMPADRTAFVEIRDEEPRIRLRAVRVRETGLDSQFRLAHSISCASWLTLEEAPFLTSGRSKHFVSGAIQDFLAAIGARSAMWAPSGLARG